MPYGRDYYWANQSANAMVYSNLPVTITGSGTTYPYVALQPVAEPAAERDFRSDRELSPVEWLTRQVDDVCRLARAA
jgi:hypothetical protein